MAGTTREKPSDKSGEEIKKIIKDKISALEEENLKLEDELSEQTKLHEAYKLDFEQQKIQYEHEIRKISEQNRKLKKEIEDKTKQLEQITEHERDYFTLENQKFALKERIRQLEAERRESQSQVARYEREIRKLRGELESMKKPPLVIGTLIDVIDERRAVVRSSAGPRFMVSVSHGIDQDILKPGVVCTLNQQSLAIVDVIRASYDEQLRGMELIESPTAGYEEIGGLEKEITEIKEAVELPLTDPEIFRKIGIEPPKGVLLYGPPGTGKTLLARAVASQTNASFIRVVGSELVQKYIGEGARLVRELFEMAKEKSPSIIFIDEIDAIGTFRTDGETSGDREVQRTLMQLLAEMDGFDNRGDVRIIGATNRIDMLDEALLRPGRFDRVIHIPLPDVDGRLSILKIHTRGMNIDKSVDLVDIAKKSEGLNGADLRAVCMEAGMYAIRSGHDTVMPDDFERALLKLASDDEYHFNNRYGVGEMFA